MDSCDGARCKFKRHIVLRLVQEDDMTISVIETSDYHDFVIDIGDRNESRKFLVM